MVASIVDQIMISSTTAVNRPITSYSPSLWGNQFINFSLNNYTQIAENLSMEIEGLKDAVKNMLLLAASESNTMADTMNLIDTLERLGISYHFENEIEEKLDLFFNLLNTTCCNYGSDVEEYYDLYTVSLHFRLFRQHGYKLSSGIFCKFKDEKNGRFQETLKSDAKGLLSLYEAAHLRIDGEDILDDALAFATANLKSMVPLLSMPLRDRVQHALVQPLHFGNPRIEARRFISFYEEDSLKNENLLKLAKLDYNLLQMLHIKELNELSRWWRELDLVTRLPYARDRLVECFFWAMGVYHAPKCSRARIMLTKTIVLTSLIDDTYDSYGTVQELDILTQAFDRWELSEVDSLPEYMRPLYVAVLKLYEQFHEELVNEGRSYAVTYAINALQELVTSYYVEAKWFLEGYLPPFSEYMKNALITCTYSYHTTTSLLGIESATEDQFNWLSNKPKMLLASLIICRTVDDVATYEIEKERGLVTGIDGYMRENDVTKEEAMNKFIELATNSWKDLNEEYLRPSPCSRDVLTNILNLERIIDVTYKNFEDGYTRPEKVLKRHIIALFVDPIRIN